MSIMKLKENGIWKSIVAIKGEKGDTGAGVKSGGSAGQVLAKASNTDYDTIWTSLTASSISDVTATASELNLLDGATSDNVRKITASTIDIGVGASLPTGEVYFVYEN